MKNTWEIALLAVMLGLGGPAAGEAAQYFAPRYNLSANGQLQPPLTVEFQKGVPQKISASLTGTDGGEKVLVLGWQVGDGVGLCTLQKGVDYACTNWISARGNRISWCSATATGAPARPI